MPKQDLKWPGLSITDSDHDLTTRIRQYDGILKNIPAKDLLMIAASLAVKKKIPGSTSSSSESFTRQIIHPSNMGKQESEEYRQFIALIYYLTTGQKKLANLNEPQKMVKNFTEYAQRGLRYLEKSYLEMKTGSDDLLNDLVDLMKKINNSI